MATEYVPKTQAVLEIMQRSGVGRFVVERQINKMEEAGSIRFIDDPRDIRKKLISREHVEAVVQALTPA
ncbi:MAG TPA: hypothetical protein VF792_00280 [Ktedonobacterales bacterium]